MKCYNSLFGKCTFLSVRRVHYTASLTVGNFIPVRYRGSSTWFYFVPVKFQFDCTGIFRLVFLPHIHAISSAQLKHLGVELHLLGSKSSALKAKGDANRSSSSSSQQQQLQWQQQEMQQQQQQQPQPRSWQHGGAEPASSCLF